MGKEKLEYPLNLCEKVLNRKVSKIENKYVTAITKIVNKLQEEQHALLMYRFRDGMSYKEIADKTQLGTESEVYDMIQGITSDIRKDHMICLLKSEEEQNKGEEEFLLEQEIKSVECGETYVDTLNIPMRMKNIIRRQGYKDLKELDGISKETIRSWRNCGTVSAEYIIGLLEKYRIKVV